jgi:hypothetical protein
VENKTFHHGKLMFGDKFMYGEIEFKLGLNCEIDFFFFFFLTIVKGILRS